MLCCCLIQKTETMKYIWNIYQPYDPTDLGDDPFDIFVYSIRMDEEPFLNCSLYVEGKPCKIVSIQKDHGLSETTGFDNEQYFKVAVV